MFKKLLAAAVLLLFAASGGTAWAQDTGTIVGTVVDSVSTETIPGANVVVQDLNKGAATGPDGQFRITGVPAGEQQLTISFVGYQTKTMSVAVSAGETTTADVALSPQTVGLQDVVVTALGRERSQRSLGYSVQQVEGAQISKVPETNFVATLAGRVSGADIQQSNSLGGSTRFVLRGVSSIAGNNQPLIVIDGIPINNGNVATDDPATPDNVNQAIGDGGYDYGNAAQILNPEDVKSISVLKGASAAALYGSRGANGVIEVTTKSGAGREGIGVTVSSGVTFSQVYGLPDYQNKYGGGANAPFSTLEGDPYRIDTEGDQWVADYSTDQSWGPRLDGRPVRQWYSWDNVNGFGPASTDTPNDLTAGQMTPWEAHPDNVENFFETGSSVNTNVAFSHGGENFNYRLSFRNQTVGDVYPNGELQRNQISVNGNVDLSDRLSANFVANYSDQNASGRPGTGYDNENVFLQFNHFGQRQVDLGSDSYMRDIERPNGQQRGWNWFGVDGALNGSFIYTDNPYWVRYRNYQADAANRLFGKAGLSYDFTSNLTAKWNVVTDYRSERREQRVAVQSQAQGAYQEQILDVQETSTQLQLNYNRQLNDDFSLDGLAATEIRYETFKDNNTRTEGGLSAPGVFTLENSVSRPSVVDMFQENAVYSVFGAATVGFRELVYFEGTLRNDWSSTLPEDNNSYLYPSATLSFVFTGLEALQSQDILSYGKLRTSWARVGSDTDPYRLTTTFPIQTPYNGNPVLSVDNTLNNAGLDPEISSEYEIGAALEFFQNRIALDLSYYNRTTKNQILDVDVSRSSGYEQVLLNAGELQNQGVEIAASGTPVLTDDFQWDVQANWSRNVNEVKELADGLEAYTLGGEAAPFGPSVQARVGEEYGVLYGTDFVYDENGNKLLSDDGTYLQTEPKALGSYPPEWNASFGTTLTYKGVSVSGLLRGQYGGSIYSLSNLFGLYSGLYQETAIDDIREVGVIPEGVRESDGQPFEQAIEANTYFTNLFGGPDAAQVYDATFLKLQEVSVAYTVPQNLLGNVPVQRLTISLVGRNLATLYKETPNFDPANAISAGNIQGIEVGQIPPQRSFGFNVNLAF